VIIFDEKRDLDELAPRFRERGSRGKGARPPEGKKGKKGGGRHDFSMKYLRKKRTAHPTGRRRHGGGGEKKNDAHPRGKGREKLL